MKIKKNKTIDLFTKWSLKHYKTMLHWLSWSLIKLWNTTEIPPEPDAAVWEHGDKIVAQLLAAQTPGWHFLDSRMITLSLSSMDASSS